MYRRIILLFIMVCTLTGCAAFTPWTRLEGGEIKDGPRRFKAVVPADWMRFNLTDYFMLTLDGTVLDSIAVERLRFSDDLESTKKKFSRDMTPQDLAEVEIDNFKSNQDIHDFTVGANSPATVDGRPAFFIEYSYEAVGGLKVKGIHYGFIHDKWVYRIRYEAAAQHYFAKTKDDFERFIKSFAVIHPSSPETPDFSPGRKAK